MTHNVTRQTRPPPPLSFPLCPPKWFLKRHPLLYFNDIPFRSKITVNVSRKMKRVDTTITYLEITTYVQIRWKLEGLNACIDKLQRKGFYQLCTYITKTRDILTKSKSMLLYVCLVFIFTANSQNYSARSLSIN